MSNEKRVQSGVPAGGEFAAHNRPEGVALSSSASHPAAPRTPDLIATIPESVEQIAWRQVQQWVSSDYMSMRTFAENAVKAGIRAGLESRETSISLRYAPGHGGDAPDFRPEGEPDSYRDLAGEFVEGFGEWPGYFTVPGFPDRVNATHDQARRILAMLSEDERNAR